MIWVSFEKFSWFTRVPDGLKSPEYSPLEREAFLPPPKMTVSEWADERRILQAGTSRQAGPWRTETTPYLREIMDCFSDPDIRHIVLCAGTQLGKTEFLYNTIGFAIDLEPFSTLVVYPREDDAKTISRSRLQPMIRACQTLKEKIPEKMDSFQTLEQHYPGMTLYLVGANSAAALSQKPCRNVFRDEIDKYPDRVGDDADPLSLSEARTKSFWDIRKIIDVSSPTIETRGIWKQLQSCEEIREFFVPCPACGKAQTLSMDHIRWDGGNDQVSARETATYLCESCGYMIPPGEKAMTLSRGKWEATKKSPGVPQSVGFRISSLYSPWLKWGDIAEAFLKSKEKQEKNAEYGALQDFINGWLAEPWIQKISANTERSVLDATGEHEPFEVPETAIALTAGIDTQKLGFWYVIRAWARDMTSWLIDYNFVPSWELLEELLFTREYPFGNEKMKIWRACMDIGGSYGGEEGPQTDMIYDWIRRNGRGRGCQVWGVKGSSRPLQGKIEMGKPFDKTPSGKALPGGFQIVLLDTDKLKDEFWYRVELARGKQIGGAYLHNKTDQNYVKQILAEEKRRNSKGLEEWHKVSRDNHLLDCEVYCGASVDSGLFGGIKFLSEPLKVRTAEPKRANRQSGSSSSSWLNYDDSWLRR